MRGSIRLAFVLLTACACGGGGGDGGDGPASGPEAFVGSWRATGQLTVSLFTAFGPVSSVLPAEGVATIATGSRSDEILLTHENGCSISATVAVDRATAIPLR